MIRMLGSSQRYGSILASVFFFFIFHTTKSFVKKKREPVTNVRLPVMKSLLPYNLEISLRYQPEGHREVVCTSSPRSAFCSTSDNTLFYICPFSLGCRVEVAALENINPGCEGFVIFCKKVCCCLGCWQESFDIPCNLRNVYHRRRSRRTC